MATLRLERFKCVEETDELDSDSPYFLVFHGRTDAPENAELVGVRSPSWDNEIDSGDLIQVKKAVAKEVGSKSVAVLIAIEEDDDPDFIASQEFAAFREKLKDSFEHHVGEGKTDKAWLGNQLAFEAFWYFWDLSDGDDFIDAERIRITTFSGELPLLHLHGDGGYYKVRFATAA